MSDKQMFSAAFKCIKLSKVFRYGTIGTLLQYHSVARPDITRSLQAHCKKDRVQNRDTSENNLLYGVERSFSLT